MQSAGGVGLMKHSSTVCFIIWTKAIGQQDPRKFHPSTLDLESVFRAEEPGYRELRFFCTGTRC